MAYSSMSGLSISAASRASGISVRAIRYYERIGLIPRVRRHDRLAHTGGNRVFDDTDVGRLKFIHHARMLGLHLDDIRTLLEPFTRGQCPSGESAYRRTLEGQVEKINRQISHLLGLQKYMQQLIDRCDGGDPGECDVARCSCMELPNARAIEADGTSTTEEDACLCPNCR